MPILLEVGKRQREQRAIRIGVHALLSLGALGIIYPVLIVIGQTLSNDYDLRDNAVVPFYLRDRNELLLKHIFAFTRKLDLLAGRHNRNQWTNQMRMRDDRSFYETRPAHFRQQGFSLDAWETVRDDFNEFKSTLDSDRMLVKEFRIEDYYRPFLREKYGRKADEFLAARAAGAPLPEWFPMMFPKPREQRRILASRDRLGVAVMNHELRSDYLNHHGLEIMRPANVLVPFWRPGSSPKEMLWREFKASLPPEQALLVSSDSYWHNFLKLEHRNVEALNEAWGTDYEGLYELKVPLAPPADPAVRRDWERFVIKRWPRSLLRAPGRHAPAWREHVRRQLLSKWRNDPDPEARALADAARLSGEPLRAWADLALPERRPADETLSRYWCEFTASGAIPAEELGLDAPELGFRTFLRAKYGAGKGEAEALRALNSAWRTSFAGFGRIPLPLGLVDYAPARFTAWQLRRQFIGESYKRVMEYLGGRGRAAQNTLILVLLSLISALTINPIAAYSLSRFPMKHTQKMLIFFLATMAFPAEVAMIPNFLLLRDLDLLNTYAALVLPGMANGFAIFLLKGFYDSLPQELYQAAEIDGASEIQIFRLVAMPLVMPILAFIGLNTFVLAYSSFMWAFVICPKQEMWTLMVWVYDFQMKNPGANYVMAATVLVSIPPLIVFLFANRIIMKGIVIPSMK